MVEDGLAPGRCGATEYLSRNSLVDPTGGRSNQAPRQPNFRPRVPTVRICDLSIGANVGTSNLHPAVHSGRVAEPCVMLP